MTFNTANIKFQQNEEFQLKKRGEFHDPKDPYNHKPNSLTTKK